MLLLVVACGFIDESVKYLYIFTVIVIDVFAVISIKNCSAIPNQPQWVLYKE
jgi:hypothetical protein